MGEAGCLLEKVDASLLWRKLYLDNLFNLRFDRPIYWVIDALDECVSPRSLLSRIASVASSVCPIRIMFVTCWTQRLSTAFKNLSSAVPLDIHQMQTTDAEIAKFVEVQIQDHSIAGNARVRHRVTERILNLAEGIFLWAHLVLEELRHCHTEDSMNDVVESLPHGIERLYQRMASL